MPEGAIVTEADDFEMVSEWASDIDRCLEPSKSNFRPWLWLLVPALMSPFDGADVQRLLLPSITKGSVAGREDLEVAVCILLHYWVGKIAILGFGKTTVIGFAEAFPVAPSAIRKDLPDMPKSVVLRYGE